MLVTPIRHALEAATTTDAEVRPGLRVEPHFTTPGVHPYDDMDWETRDAVITDYRTGEVAFEQRDVEFPATWSMNATTIVAQKYFRGTLGTPERERSVKHMIDRVADTITGWGRSDGYFADDGSDDVFSRELKHLLVHQKAAFNSPVWFNVGVESEPQCSACFILSVEDEMSSILNWYVEEGTIFKGGSGSGVNLSRIRSSKEQLRGGGQASGPVSFMRGADASAGTIKSGGKTRRAAKMVILDVDHPDIEEFIDAKHAPGALTHFNLSVLITDAFMEAVRTDAPWPLVFPQSATDEAPADTVERAWSASAPAVTCRGRGSWATKGVNPVRWGGPAEPYRATSELRWWSR